MKKTFYLAATAALLMASSAAQAGGGFSFEINGQRIHIDAPRNCNSLSCLNVTNNGSTVNLKNLNLKGNKSSDDDDYAASAPPPAQAPAAVPAAPAPAPVATVAPPAANYTPPAPPAATYAPSAASNLPPAPPAPVTDSSRERVSGLSAPSATAAPVSPAPIANPAPVASAAPSAAPAQQQQADAASPSTPLGVWATEKNKGNVRIEQCGANLCGYGEKSNERILINMKPADNKWVGRIHDPDSGSNYDSTIAMKGPNLLKVQGCAFGGMFCGGQTWKRIS